MSIWSGFMKMGIMPDQHMEDDMKSHFEEYILFEPVRKGERLWKHTGCGHIECGPLPWKAGDRITCPECGAWAKVVSSNRARTGSSLTKWEKVLWFKALEGELFAVAADCGLVLERESWDGPDWNSWLTFNPRQVYHWDAPGGTPEVWYNNHYIGWEWSDHPREPFQGQMGPAEYAVFGWDEIRKTSMRYCGIREWSKQNFGYTIDGIFCRGVVKYLNRYQTAPKLEQIIKWGLTEFANEYIDSKAMNKRLTDWEAKTPWEFLRMTKQQYKEFHVYAPEGGVQLLKDNRKRWKLPPDHLVRLCRKVALPYTSWGDYAMEINDKYGIELKEITKYLSQEKRRAGTWRDYLDMCKRNHRDLTDHNTMYPKDLKKAHDDMVEINRAMMKERQIEEQREKDRQYLERYEQLCEKYAYRSGDMEIVIPRGGADLIEEGNTLHICVGGYAQRHLDGKTDIVFLRHARRPERSYICIEVRNGTIMQVHGYKNENYKTKDGKRPTPPSVKYKDFIDEWMAWVKAGSHRTNTEGKKLA